MLAEAGRKKWVFGGIWVWTYQNGHHVMLAGADTEEERCGVYSEKFWKCFPILLWCMERRDVIFWGVGLAARWKRNWCFAFGKFHQPAFRRHMTRPNLRLQNFTISPSQQQNHTSLRSPVLSRSPHNRCLQFAANPPHNDLPRNNILWFC